MLTCSVGKFYLPTRGDDREPRQQLSSFTELRAREKASKDAGEL